jgi:hypothetical protein
MVSGYKYLVAFAVALLVPGQPAAQDLGDEAGATAARTYNNCLDLGASDPAAAFELALNWRDHGGGLPARHCMALAQAGSGNYRAAAVELERIAEDQRAGRGMEFGQNVARDERFLLADLYGQAGNVWMLAEDGGRANDAFSQALAEAPGAGEQTVELLIDRARALALLGDLEDALLDLNHAHLLLPQRVDVLIYQASAHRILYDVDAAAQAIAEALALDPDSPGALLERGNLRLWNGNDEGARQDWQRVISLDSLSPAADAARINIAALEARSPQ